MLTQSYHLWFENLNKPYEEGFDAEITSNFDYEARPDGSKWVYIDTGIKLYYASVVYRTGFEFVENDLTWADIFVFDKVQTMLKTAFEETEKGYKLYCEVNKIPLPESCTIPKAYLKPFTQGIIDQYTNYCSISDQQNSYLINTITAEYQPEYEAYLVLKYTFEILEEVLFYNQNFKTAHNREVFNDVIPLSRYFTLRYNCRAIEYENVSLNGYDMVMFFQCLDCALQMLLNDKSDYLISVLEQQGFDAELRKAFIKSGTNHFTLLNETLHNSKARITNLENRIDWLNVIK